MWHDHNRIRSIRKISRLSIGPMGALPDRVMDANVAQTETRKDWLRNRLPDYLPARMVNEFVYCPRLFFYEWVEGLFRESADTVEGKSQHERVDAKTTELPKPEDEQSEKIHSRSVMLSSEQHRVIAKMDLLEAAEGVVTPVDYKHGAPRETEHGLELWPTDRIQLAVQGLILRENGYRSEEGVVFYQKTRQRVRVEFSEELMNETKRTIAAA